MPVAEARPAGHRPGDGAPPGSDAPVLPALPPVPSEMAEALPAAFSPRRFVMRPASGVPVRPWRPTATRPRSSSAADPACNVGLWALVAAIGKVESNHGTYAGNGIGDLGTVLTGIYGLPLNGPNDTATIPDSDGGALDRDAQWDRAVGPMQFIPTTWAVVGVDGDGNEDPQNITDAAGHRGLPARAR